MNPRPGPFLAFRLIVFATVAAFVYYLLFRSTYIWCKAHFQGTGDYREYLKLFWALVVTFAVNQRFQKIGLKFPRRGSYVVGVLTPVSITLGFYEAIGYYPGFDANLLRHNLCVGMAEELICNGCIIVMLRPIGIDYAAYISSFIFTLFHLPLLLSEGQLPTFGVFEAAVGIFIYGVFLAGIRFYSDSLLPGIFIHFLFDYLINFYSQGSSLFSWWRHEVTPVEYTIWEWTVELVFLVYGIGLLLLSKKREASATG